MNQALDEAREARASGEVPVGAVIVDATGRIIARAQNRREREDNPLLHAEVIAIQAAAAVVGSWNLSECTLIVTLEPCVMCAGAILQSRISQVAFGAWDEKAGAAGSVHDLLRDRRLPHKVEVVSGILAEESSDLLHEFFLERRN
ncbi:MAG: nucleoside deaminase [Microbacteriaceae bacterium]|nr:nucleoside deaminase [Microbacteriaceae bacterium]